MKVLGIMRIEALESSEDFEEAMRISSKLRVTFYDASYIQTAKRKGLTLVTDDIELREKAGQVNLKAVSTGQLLSHGVDAP